MQEEKKVEELLSLPLAERGYELHSVRLSRGKKETTLSVVVDRVEPISLQDIVDISELVSGLLDKADPISGAYVLDLSSLGAEKPIALEKLPLYVGSYVNLHLSHPYKGENVLEGTLKSVEEDTLHLEIKVKARKLEALIPLKDVDKARLAIEF